MKKIIVLAIAALSLSSFAGETERDFVKVTDTSAQGAYEKALDMVEFIKNAKREAKLPMLRNCNYTGSDADRTWYRRKAWTNSSSVRLNHVNGIYTATVNVSCQK
jgi:hypothetical protein